MTASLTTIDLGNPVRVGVVFRNEVGPADPSAVTLSITSPTLVVATYTYGVDAGMIRDALGRFHFDHLPDALGRNTTRWIYTWQGDTTIGPGKVAGRRTAYLQVT